MLVCQMIEAAPFSQFLYFNIGKWVFRFSNNQQPNQCELKCNNCQTKSILFFNKFHLILFCLFVSKMKKIVTKYVVCYSNNKCLKTNAAIPNAHLSRVCKRGKLSGSCLSTLNGFGSTQLPIFLCHIGVPTFSSQNN